MNLYFPVQHNNDYSLRGRLHLFFLKQGIEYEL